MGRSTIITPITRFFSAHSGIFFYCPSNASGTFHESQISDCRNLYAKLKYANIAISGGVVEGFAFCGASFSYLV